MSELDILAAVLMTGFVAGLVLNPKGTLHVAGELIALMFCWL